MWGPQTKIRGGGSGEKLELHMDDGKCFISSAKSGKCHQDEASGVGTGIEFR